MDETSVRDATKLYDEQFNENMKIAKYLLKHLHDRDDIQLAKKWLVRINDIKSSSLEVRRSCNAFLYYLLKVLKETVLKHNRLDSENNSDSSDSSKEHLKMTAKRLSATSNVRCCAKWSKNYRTYVAMRPLPERGALIYMAVSIKPGLENWDIDNLGKHTH